MGTGEQAAIGRSAEGDFYAGKDGSVYRRDEGGWHQNTGDGWNKVEVPDDRAAQMDQTRSSLSTKRDSIAQSRPADRPTRSQTQSTLSSSGFAASYGSARAADSWSNRTYDSTRNRSQYDGSRRNDLNRSYNARTNGYQRYNNRSAGAGNLNRPPGSRPAPRRRR